MSLTITTSRPASACDRLFERYADRVVINRALDRTLVSFQANKSSPVYRWFKYKEGFSHRLVEYLATTLKPKAGSMLDPFAGAGAALFALRDLGWKTTGIEMMPVGHYAMEMRLASEGVDPDVFARQVRAMKGMKFGRDCPSDFAFPHITITRDAFSEKTEKELGGYLKFVETDVADVAVRKLLSLPRSAYSKTSASLARMGSTCVGITEALGRASKANSTRATYPHSRTR